MKSLRLEVKYCVDCNNVFGRGVVVVVLEDAMDYPIEEVVVLLPSRFPKGTKGLLLPIAYDQRIVFAYKGVNVLDLCWVSLFEPILPKVAEAFAWGLTPFRPCSIANGGMR